MTREILIISDLHLSAERPGTVALFLRFLEEQLSPHTQLYILGDLFDAWVGDDDTTPPIPDIKRKLRTCHDQGSTIFFMPGNRDFLIGEQFISDTGCTLLDDPTLIEIENVPTLLMHGDLLCTDDQAYMQARKYLRSPDFITDILTKTIEERKAIAADFRRRSGEANSLKAADIMDVNQDTVEGCMREHQATQLIHGHTHRPDIHHFSLDRKAAKRIVLSEWHERSGSYLRAGHSGLDICPFPPL